MRRLLPVFQGQKRGRAEAQASAFDDSPRNKGKSRAERATSNLQDWHWTPKHLLEGGETGMLQQLCKAVGGHVRLVSRSPRPTPITMSPFLGNNEPNQSALETAPEIETEQESRLQRDSVWSVVVLNDPVNLMSYVTYIFQKVFGYSKSKAEHHMLEVHRNGRSVVWSGERERAEFYVQQLHASLLLAKIEKLP